MAAPPADKKKKPAYAIAKAYKVEGGKIVSRPKQSPKKAGCFMANHKDRLTCGATSYMEVKGAEPQAEEKPVEAEAKKA